MAEDGVEDVGVGGAMGEGDVDDVEDLKSENSDESLGQVGVGGRV